MPDSLPTPSRLTRPVLVLIIAASLIVGVGAGVAGYRMWLAEDTNTPTTNVPSNANTSDILANTNSSVNKNINGSTANTNTEFSLNNSKIAGNDVDWKLEFIDLKPEYSITKDDGQSYTEPSRYYKLGTIKTGTYPDSPLYLLEASYEGPSIYPAFIRFVVKDNKKIVLTKISDTYSIYEGRADIPDLDISKFTTDAKTTFVGLSVPEKISGLNSRQTLLLDPYPRGLFSSLALNKVVFSAARVGDVETKVTETATPGFQNTPTLEQRNGFYVELADGTLAVYQYQADFIPSDGVAAITWNDGAKNADVYSMQDLGGCGGTNYASVISPLTVNTDRDLVKIGTSSKGDVMYGFKDSNHLFLKRHYEEAYQKPWEGEKVSYEDFVKAHPIVFFVDPFDRMIKLQSTKYGPQVECGKPVIYLYPEKTTDVHVDLRPAGGFSKSEPRYDGGWDVRATPSGQLTERKSGKQYHYLFWEGRGGVYQTPDRGFVVSKANVSTFLDEKLSALGLRDREITDFKEFWLPRMQAAPWYFVTFSGNRVMDQLAPLKIYPQPDSVIRILMDFKELSAPISVKPLEIRTPSRNGFTVVEWGGVLK